MAPTSGRFHSLCCGCQTICRGENRRLNVGFALKRDMACIVSTRILRRVARHLLTTVPSLTADDFARAEFAMLDLDKPRHLRRTRLMDGRGTCTAPPAHNASHGHSTA